MIIDSLDNIKIYRAFSNDIYLGLKFLKEANDQINVGIYKINENVKAIVEEYSTEFNKVPLFESHKKVIDIQYPIIGLERVLWSPIHDMEIHSEYNEKKDYTLFKSPHSQASHADIGNNIFAIMFRQDGHSPKHCISEEGFIKKITIKVSFLQ